MIIDTLDNLEKYAFLNPLLKEVISFLKANEVSSLPEGHHPIKGEDVFVNIQARAGKTRKEAVLEYHRQMIDIQIPFNTTETYGYRPTAELPQQGFDAKKDIGFAEGVEPQQYVSCQPGMFVMFFPQDGHAPLISDAKEVKKAIFKIKA
jgi:YhcH/YjgK/YiaL family protein